MRVTVDGDDTLFNLIVALIRKILDVIVEEFVDLFQKKMGRMSCDRELLFETFLDYDGATSCLSKKIAKSSIGLVISWKVQKTISKNSKMLG